LLVGVVLVVQAGPLVVLVGIERVLQVLLELQLQNYLEVAEH
jgi:hypothetical protein